MTGKNRQGRIGDKVFRFISVDTACQIQVIALAAGSAGKTLAHYQSIAVSAEEGVVRACRLGKVHISGVDMQTAVNSKAIAIGVLWGFRGREELKQNGAEFIASTPNDIYEIIKKL